MILRDMIRKIENLMAFSKIYNLSGINAGKDVLFSIGCIHPCLCHVGRQVKMFVFAHSSSFLLLSCLDYFHSVFARVGWLVTCRDIAAAPKPPNWGGPRPTLGAQVSLKLLFGYVTIFSSADLFTTDLNCRKKLAFDIISECNVILSRTI